MYFSLDDEAEQYFHTALSQKIKVDVLGDAEWYIGIKFDWCNLLMALFLVVHLRRAMSRR